MWLILYDASDPSVQNLCGQLAQTGIPYEAIDFKTLIDKWMVCTLPSGQHIWQNGRKIRDESSYTVIYQQMHRLQLAHVSSFPKADRLYAFESWRAYLHAFLIRQHCVINPIHRQSLFSPSIYIPMLYHRARDLGFNTPLYTWAHQPIKTSHRPAQWVEEWHGCLSLQHPIGQKNQGFSLMYPPASDHIVEVFNRRYACTDPQGNPLSHNQMLPRIWYKRLIQLTNHYQLMRARYTLKITASKNIPYLYALDNHPKWPDVQNKIFWSIFQLSVHEDTPLMSSKPLLKKTTYTKKTPFIPKNLRPNLMGNTTQKKMETKC